MGISSTKRGIRTQAAMQEYRDNWEANFGEGRPAPWQIKRWQAQYAQQIKDLLLQDPELAEETLRLLGYTKEKAPAQEEPGLCPLGDSCLNLNYEVGSGRLCEGCGR